MKKMKTKSCIITLTLYCSLIISFFTLVLQGCVSSKTNLKEIEIKTDIDEADKSDEDDEADEADSLSGIYDPLESFNRLMFKFNDKVYFAVLKPVALQYNKIAPESFRIGMRNILKNVEIPKRFVNSLLQFKLKKSAVEIGRFCTNSTIGILGYNDAASNYDILKPMPSEDLGQTLGYYGIGDGFYIVMPFLGPSSVRDIIGNGGDGFLDPISYIRPWYYPTAIGAYNVVNTTSLRIGEYEYLIENVFEPYVSIRDVYWQHRNKEIGQ